jgi:hypothetical protein
MRFFATCLFSLSLAVSPAMGDGGATKDSADTAKATPAKKSGDTAKKAAPDSAPNFEAELQQLREEVARQREALEREHQKVQALELRLGMTGDAAPAAETPGTPTAISAAATPAVRSARPQEDRPKESPLSFRIGGTEFTPGGFVDFENIFRTTNTGNVAATNFWAIPFSNTPAGHLTEFRMTGQYSRYSLKVTGKYGATSILGFLEGDFNGNDAANVFVSSNSHTNRLRLYFVDLKRGNWEFLGGQAWGLMTPNRTGLSPMPADLALPIGNDAQVHVGAGYTRANQFRAIYHFNDKFQWGLAIENPQQFTGQGAEVVFPTAFAATLGGEFDAAATPGAPNAFPDLMTKVAYDTTLGGRKFHWEGGGLMTSVKTATIPTVVGATFTKHKKIGGGFETAISYDLFKSGDKYLRFLGSGMWGNGIGRYLIGMGPQAVIAPVPFGGIGACVPGATGNCDVAISMVHSGNAIIGFELQPHPKTLFGFYAGGAYFQRNAFKDLTSAGVGTVPCFPGDTAPFKPCAGFGAPLQAGNTVMNRALEEVTLDWTQTLWKNPQYGAIQIVTQTSYVNRAPWWFAPGTPKNAHLMMAFVSMRYVLP